MFRALQSVVDKNTYLVERMSAPHLATLKGGEMFFTLNFFPKFCNFHHVFITRDISDHSLSWCQEDR